MKRRYIKLMALALAVACGCTAYALDWNRLFGAVSKGVTAMNISDQEMSAYVHKTVVYMDSTNTVAPASNPYSVRLARLTKNLKSVNGMPLNFKVYLVKDVNAFACADGSVRVFSSLMDIMNDDELLGIIGHEVGHVALQHTKNAFKNALINDALRDALASTSNSVAALTDSQLAKLTDMYYSSKFSRKQERQADDYGYNFLKQSGINPWGMVMAFEQMQALERQASASGQNYGYITKMFSSHPETAERIERLTKRAKADGYQRPASTK